MKWEWKGGEDRGEQSGIITLNFTGGEVSFELPYFGKAHHLAQLVERETREAERRGLMEAVARYNALSESIGKRMGN